jgi:N-acetyl-gamma-glutamyl-phosphate reductase
MSIHAVVLGGAGYVGGELLRLIDAHPVFRLAAAASSTFAGKPVADVFPHLGHSCAGMSFVPPGEWPGEIPAGSDVALFSAAPHGASAGAIADALRAAKNADLNVHVVDASADFRFDNAAAFSSVYGIEHPAPALLEDFTSGVPEHVAGSNALHACQPGCFATAALLAAVPLVDAGVTAGDLFLNGVTGSTGSGRSVKPGTHHPERHSNMYAYKPLSHRHAPEIEHLLHRSCGGDSRVHFVPHSGPFARGIHMTLQAQLRSAVSADDLRDAFTAFYADSPFVRVVDTTPRLKDIVASNFSHIGVAVDDRAVTVMCVIDNLVKGAAGGAMQWMNRLWSLPEDSGLLAAAPSWT